MKKSILMFLAALALAVPAAAQETPAGPGRMEVTFIPGGATVFTQNADASAPDFGSYDVGGAFTYNVNRIVGIEGEVGGSIGMSQSLDFNFPGDVRTPDMLTYSGNVVVSAPTGTSFVPYATGGVGGLSLFSREALGMNDSATLFTTNVGGGVKWYAGR
jgi:hypothetical protein